MKLEASQSTIVFFFYCMGFNTLYVVLWPCDLRQFTDLPLEKWMNAVTQLAYCCAALIQQERSSRNCALGASSMHVYMHVFAICCASLQANGVQAQWRLALAGREQAVAAGYEGLWLSLGAYHLLRLSRVERRAILTL
jgi:hypothetical protein